MQRFIWQILVALWFGWAVACGELLKPDEIGFQGSCDEHSAVDSQRIHCVEFQGGLRGDDDLSRKSCLSKASGSLNVQWQPGERCTREGAFGLCHVTTTKKVEQGIAVFYIKAEALNYYYGELVALEEQLGQSCAGLSVPKRADEEIKAEWKSL